MSKLRPVFTYTKKILESVSFNSELFKRELQKAYKNLYPYELDLLNDWLKFFVSDKPHLVNFL
jgi:hypothetical protein